MLQSTIGPARSCGFTAPNKTSPNKTWELLHAALILLRCTEALHSGKGWVANSYVSVWHDQQQGINKIFLKKKLQTCCLQDTDLLSEMANTSLKRMLAHSLMNSPSTKEGCSSPLPFSSILIR